MHRETGEYGIKMAVRKGYILKYTGALSVLLFFSLCYVASLYTPGFSIWKNAYSDLGTRMSGCPCIFNYSLIFLIAPLMGAFSLYLIKISRGKIQTVGASFILVASTFIAFIGIFPKGRGPHDFVAFWFFMSYFIGILLWSVKEDSPRKVLGIVLFLLFLIGFIIPFPSVALAETYALILILIFTTTIALSQQPKE